MAAPGEQPAPAPDSTPPTTTPPASAEAPVIARAREGVEAKHEGKREEVKAGDTEKRAEVAKEAEALAADKKAEKALSEGLDASKARLEGEIAKVEAATKNETVKANMTKGRASLAALDTAVDAKLQAVTKKRDSNDHDGAKAALEEAQALIQEELVKVGEEDWREAALDKPTTEAIAALRAAAEGEMETINDLFESRYVSLEALEPAPAVAAAPTTKPPATPPAVPAAESPAPTASAEATVALPPEVSADLERLKMGNPFERVLAGAEGLLSQVNTGWGWMGLSTTHTAKEAALKNAKAAVEAARKGSNVDSPKVTALFAEHKYDEALAYYQSLVATVDTGLKNATTALTAVEGWTEVGGITKGIEEARTVGVPERTRQIQTTLTQAKGAVAAQKSAAKPTATPETPSASVETAAQKAEREKAEIMEATKTQLKEGLAKLTKAYSEKPPNMGKVLGAGLQVLGAALSLLKSGDIASLGSIVEEIFGEGATPEGVFKNGLALLKAMGIGAREIAFFTAISMEDLFMFYEHKENAAKPAPTMDAKHLKALEAFYRDDRETYNTVMQQIFEEHGGRAYAQNKDKKGRSVLAFFTEKKAEEWGVKPPESGSEE